MDIRKSVRRIIATTLMTAGLAYPVCAAVCPKGIGNCPAPGRCFLFTDADGNSLCDYTGRTASSSGSGAISSRPAAQATTQPAATPAPATSGSTGSSTADALHLSAFITEAALFLALASVLFLAFRRGVLGVQVRETLPDIALSCLFALPLSLMGTSVLTGSAIPGTVFALAWMAAGTVLVACPWHTRTMTRPLIVALAAAATLAGFVFLAPIMPLELGGLVGSMTGRSAITAGIIVILSVIAVTFVIGRTFCASVCPVGALQELAYCIPVRKYVPRSTRIMELVRIAVLAAAVIAVLYLVDLMEVTGLYDLFALTLSAGLVIAAALVIFSIFLYRPVCRILCPFGAIFSLPAAFSRFRLRRTPACISCGKCERACPAVTAGRDDPKRECYLCGRCTVACPVEGALWYRR